VLANPEFGYKLLFRGQPIAGAKFTPEDGLSNLTDDVKRDLFLLDLTKQGVFDLFLS